MLCVRYSERSSFVALVYITNIVQCHSVPVLPRLLCVELSLGKNIDKVNCNSKGSLPAAEINRISRVKTVSAFFFFSIYIFSLANCGAGSQHSYAARLCAR